MYLLQTDYLIVNIHHLTELQICFSPVKRVFKNYSEQLSSVQYSSISYSHHPQDWLVLLTGSLYLHPFHLPITRTSGNFQSVICICEVCVF